MRTTSEPATKDSEPSSTPSQPRSGEGLLKRGGSRTGSGAAISHTPPTHAQFNLQEDLNHSPRVASLKALQEIANGSPQVTAQRKLSHALSGIPEQDTVAINDDSSLENEADVLGAQALLHGQAAPAENARQPAATLQRDTLQREKMPGASSQSPQPGKIVQMYSASSTPDTRLQTGIRYGSAGPTTGFQPNAGESSGAVIQRQVLARFEILDHKEGNAVFILEVVIAGRTPSPFPGTMGAHSTAWVAHLDAVRRMLVNTELAEGAGFLLFLAEEGLKSPLGDLKKFLEKDHLDKLDASQKTMQADIATLKELVASYAYPPSDEQFLKIEASMRRLIDSYLTYINYLPMSTVKGGDPSGHGEGSVRSDISAFEYVNARVQAEEGNDDLSPDLTKEIRSLVNTGIQGKIKQAGLARFVAKDDERSKFTLKDSTGLVDALIESLWSLFAAETPGVFGKDKAASNEDWVLIWHAAVKNFLHTIMRAYPYAFDYTKMHTMGPQLIGLKFALGEANIKASDEQLAAMLPAFSEEAETRGGEEVTLSDLKQSGTGFLATILVGEGGVIGEVQMIGRTKSPFSSTMGAHTTAWVAHLDAVRSILIGKKVFVAIKSLQAKAKEAMQDEGLDLIHVIGDKHQVFLVGAYNVLLECGSKVESQEKLPLNQQTTFLETYVMDYLSFINFLPLSTIDVGAVPGGRAEGKHRTFLQNYELLGPKMFTKESSGEQREQLLKHLNGLYDKTALPGFTRGAKDSSFKLGRHVAFDSTHPLSSKVAAKGEGPSKTEVARRRFYATLLEAYPRSVQDSGLLQETDIGKEVSTSLDEILKNESEDLLEILHDNNCLINAINEAANGTGTRVTEQQLLEIRIRIGQIGTMLIASPRTVSIICDVLKISRGVVVIYPNGPSEDFGDTAHAPVMIRHTGALHFVAWDESHSLELVPYDNKREAALGGFLPLTVLKQIEPTLFSEIDDLINDTAEPGNLFFQLPTLLPVGSWLAFQAHFIDELTGKQSTQEFLFHGFGPPALALSGGSGPLVPRTSGQIVPYGSRKKRKRPQPTAPRKRVKRVEMVFQPPQGPPFTFFFNLSQDFDFGLDFTKRLQ